jgi:aquaporin Z
MARKVAAELLGTALLVLFGAGAATLMLGFRIFGTSLAAGILAVALAFGLIYAALVYVIGPISGGHVNPAVTLGAFLCRRISAVDLAAYWAAQLVGAAIGALLLFWMVSTSPVYTKSRIGLGANGWGASSLLRIGAGGAFLTEVILTAVFVLVVLSLTREGASVPVSGMGIGIALALVNLIGIPFDGASVNPARSFGPAVVVGGTALRQLWLFLVAPLVGAAFAAGIHLLLHPVRPSAGAAGQAGPSDERAEPQPVAAAGQRPGSQAGPGGPRPLDARQWQRDPAATPQAGGPQSAETRGSESPGESRP